jgi:hypothetical protein
MNQGDSPVKLPLGMVGIANMKDNRGKKYER